MSKSLLQIIIDATVRGQRDVKKLNDELGGMGKQSLKAGDMLKALGNAALAATAVIAGVGVAAKQTWEYIGEGAELNAAKGRFDALTESIGVTSDAMMRTLRDATKGMVSDVDLVASATDIISLGLANTEGDVARLATVISTLGLDMQQVILTFANNSTMRLDALGLSVEDVTTKAKELEEQGFVGDAFDEAVLIALEEKMTLLGDASKTTAGKMSILEAAAKDMSSEGKQVAAAILEASGALDAMVDRVQLRQQIIELFNAGIIGAKEQSRMITRMTLSSEGFAEIQREMIPLLKEYNQQIKESEHAAAFYRLEMQEMEKAYQRQQDQVQLAAEGADVLFGNYVSLTTAADEYAYSLEQLAQMGREAQQAQNDLNQEMNRQTVGALNNVNADPFLAYIAAREDMIAADGEWVEVTITNAAKIAEVNAQLAGDLNKDQVKAYQDILNTVEEGSAEWLAAYNALQGDLTDSQRQALVAQMAELQAAGDTVASVYTGNAAQAEAAKDAMREAHEEIIDSYRELAIEAIMAEAEMSMDPNAIQTALDYAVAIGYMTEEERLWREETANVNTQLGVLSGLILENGTNADIAAAAFNLLTGGAAATAQEALNMAGRMQDVIDRTEELNGRTVNLSFSAQGLAELEARLAAFKNGTTGGADKKPGGPGTEQGKPTSSNEDARAYGGPVSPFGSYLVGEMGPELFVPATAGNIIPNGQLGGGHTVNIYVSGGGRGAQQQAQQIATAVTDALGRLN